jgi:hypothetical protein
MPSLKTRLLHALSEQQAEASRVSALEASVETIGTTVETLESNIGDADIGSVFVTIDGIVIDISSLSDRIAALETP